MNNTLVEQESTLSSLSNVQGYVDDIVTQRYKFTQKITTSAYLELELALSNYASLEDQFEKYVEANIILEENYIDLCEKNKECVDKLEKFNQVIEEKEVCIEEMKGQISFFQKENEALYQSIEEQQHRISDEKSKSASLSEKVKENEQHISGLDEKLAVQVDEIETLTSNCQDFSHQIRTLTESRDSLKKELLEEQDLACKIKVQLEKAECERDGREEECENLIEKLSAATSKRRQTLEEMKILKDKHNLLIASSEVLEQRANYAEEKCKDLEELLVRTTLERNDARTELQHQKTSSTELEAKLNACEKKLVELTNVYDDKCNECINLTQINELERSNWNVISEKYEECNSQLEDKISSLYLELDNTSRMISALATEEEKEIERRAQEEKEALRAKYNSINERYNRNLSQAMDFNVFIHNENLKIQEIQDETTKDLDGIPSKEGNDSSGSRCSSTARSETTINYMYNDTEKSYEVEVVFKDEAMHGEKLVIVGENSGLAGVPGKQEHNVSPDLPTQDGDDTTVVTAWNPAEMSSSNNA